MLRLHGFRVSDPGANAGPGARTGCCSVGVLLSSAGDAPERAPVTGAREAARTRVARGYPQFVRYARVTLMQPPCRAVA